MEHAAVFYSAARRLEIFQSDTRIKQLHRRSRREDVGAHGGKGRLKKGSARRKLLPPPVRSHEQCECDALHISLTG